MVNRKELQVLYERLLRAPEIPVIETEIWSPGFYQSQGGEHRIYIKQDLNVSEKTKVFIHEYVHYLHMSKYYEDESRAECEIIAECAAYFVCEQLNVRLFKEMDFETLYVANPTRDSLLRKSRQIANELVKQIRAIEI